MSHGQSTPVRLAKIATAIVLWPILGTSLFFHVLGRMVHAGRFVSNGFEQLVYQQGEVAHKLVIETISRDESWTSNRCHELQRVTKIAMTALDGQWLETSYETVRLGWTNWYVVMARQKYLRSVKTYRLLNDLVNEFDDEHIRRETLKMVIALRRLESQSIYADIVGANNIARMLGADGKEHIVLIDTLPIDGKMANVIHADNTDTMRQRIDERLKYLEAMLQTSE